MVVFVAIIPEKDEISINYMYYCFSDSSGDIFKK
jgi:hypothetical protein